MPRAIIWNTPSMPAKVTKKKKPSIKPPRIPTGWRTTDADEIARRQQRAADDNIQIDSVLGNPVPGNPVLGKNDFYGSYRVSFNEGQNYRVEIRSLSKLINSCECPDHRVNGLGTCKHIEATLLQLQFRKKRAFKEADQLGSPFIEIFLNRRQQQIQIQWPLRSRQRSEARRLLGPFFDNNYGLIGDPLDTMPSVLRAVSTATSSIKRKIMVSQELIEWLNSLDRHQQQIRNRRSFETHLVSGKENLDLVRYPLYTYQHEGMIHLAFTGRALLADEMGLGKTVQAIAACELLRRTQGIKRVLVVSPASLKGEWEEQIEKFTELRSVIVEGTRANRLKKYRQPEFFTLCNYEQIRPDVDDINSILAPDVIILDEAQRIKNWRTKTAAAVKRLNSSYAFVLTGTPLENRIDEIYSIVQFLDPQILGPLFRFNREYYQLDENGRAAGYKNLDKLHQQLKSVMLRRRKEEVEGQLPGLTVNTYFVPMHKEQLLRYTDHKFVVARLAAQAARRSLRKEEMELMQKNLACMRMLCDTPYILDPDCRVSPKLVELDNILQEIFADGEHKIIIFSEWERMLKLVREHAENMSIGYAWHTGSVSQSKRRDEIKRFKSDVACRLFLSTDSGSVGLNLQDADIVINLDIPWNPAKLDQRIARAWRKHQTRAVQVINLVSEHTIEHSMLSLLEQKRSLADSVLEGKGYSEMQLPSGRSALVDRVGVLIDHESERQQKKEDPYEALQQDLSSYLDDRLMLMELHGRGRGSDQTLMLVVDQVDKRLQDELDRKLQLHFPHQTPGVKLLDQNTYNVIQQLVETGVLSAGQNDVNTLYRSEQPTAPKVHQESKYLAEARAVFASGERKRKMSAVLADGGFEMEALVPLREVIEGAARAALLSRGHDVESPVDTNLLRSELIEPKILPDVFASVVEHFRVDPLSASNAEATNLLNQANMILDKTAELLN